MANVPAWNCDDAIVEPPNHWNDQVQTSEASFPTEAGDGQSKLTPEQRNKKKQADHKYKEKIKDLWGTLGALVPGCSELKTKEERLNYIINYIRSLRQQDEEIERLNVENTSLKEELDKQLHHPSVSHLQPIEEMVPVNAASSMSAAASPLTEGVGLMQGPQDILEISAVNPVSVMESQLNSTEPSRDALLQVQEIPHNNGRKSQSVLPSNQEAKHGTRGSGNESDESEFSSGGAEDEPSVLNGISGEPSAKVLSSEKGKQSVEEAQVDQAKGGQPSNGATMTRSLAERDPGKAAMLDETIEYVQSLERQKFRSMKLSASHHGDVAAAMNNIIKKLEADDESMVKFSDFTGLDGKRKKVGKYKVPRSLLLIAKKINGACGSDVSATGKMNSYASEANYIMFCAAVKEMSDLPLEQVTEDLLLKWRDAIKDALRSNFKVDFAMEHLKKIARAYIGLMEFLKLENEALRMFNDTHVGSGEEPFIGYESVDGDDDGGGGVCRPPARKKRKLRLARSKNKKPMKRQP